MKKAPPLSVFLLVFTALIAAFMFVLLATIILSKTRAPATASSEPDKMTEEAAKLEQRLDRLHSTVSEEYQKTGSEKEREKLENIREELLWAYDYLRQTLQALDRLYYGLARDLMDVAQQVTDRAAESLERYLKYI